MNWSTRLRRWVRIRTPPVREASMKPTAATVLPAPVACSNQKRRLAPGSSGASATISSSSVLRLLPVLRLLVRGEHLVLVVELGDRGAVVRSSPRRRRAPLAVAPLRPLGLAVLVGLLDLGDDRRQRAGERVDLVLVELGAVEQLRRLVGQQALEAEQQRVVAPPLERGRLGAGVELGEGGVDRQAAGGARRQLGDRLVREQDRLAGELPRPIEVGLAQLASRARGYVGGIGHGQGEMRSRASR